jgi:Ca-activated chloride channel family protein
MHKYEDVFMHRSTNLNRQSGRVFGDREHFPEVPVQPGTKRLILAAMALAGICASLPSFAAGFIIIQEPGEVRILPHPVPPYPIPRPIPPPRGFAPLEVTSESANACITDQIAVTTLDQEFYNPNPQRLEGTFILPVPRGAVLNKFTLEIDGKPVEAELLAADKARRIYEDIVRTLRDPALLEYAGRDIFKARIFPIEPHSHRRISISWSQVLKSDSGLVGYSLPCSDAKSVTNPSKHLSIKMEVDAKSALKSVYSPTHAVEIRRDGRKAVIAYESRGLKPDSDFQLYFSQENGDLGINLLTQKASDTDGYFLLLASPGDASKDHQPFPKDVVFVLDTSGSMAGEKIEQAKKALLFCVEALNPDDRFEILRFSTDTEPLFNKLVEASKPNRAQARNFIKDLKAMGGTAIDDALGKALALRTAAKDRPCVIIFLTDGMPTVGVTNEDQILENLRKAGAASTRIFCFGIGLDVNTHLLDRIADETRAFTQYVLPEEDIEIKVSSFFTKIREPALVDVRISFPDGVRVSKMYPAPLPDLFKGDQLILAGRYSGTANGAIVIQGSVGGASKKYAFDARFPAQSSDHDFIPRLWATRRIGYLLDEVRLHGENPEVRDEVTDLSRQYGIVTPYTAWLIIDDERRRGLSESRRSLNEFEKSSELVRQTKDSYLSFQNDKSGGAAVAGAKSSYYFKRAEQASEAATLANTTLREAASTAGHGLGAPPSAGLPNQSPTRAPADLQGFNFGQQNRFVGGKNFFQNGAQWIDGDQKTQSNARRVRIKFASPEYFALLDRNPNAQLWLALGRNVQFALGDAVYEVFDE